MKWDDIRIFLGVARTGSLTEAAAGLGVNQSTVSRRLAVLERDLGALLVERGPEGHVLTAAGSDLLVRAQNIEEEFGRIDRQIAGRDARLSGSLRVTCVDIMVERYLAPHIARFCRDNPEIALSVVAPLQPVDMARREADVAIRVSDNPPEMLVGRRLFDFALGVYAAPDMAVALPADPDPADLAWVGWESEDYNERMIGAHFPAAKIHHRVDSLLVARALVHAGMGVAVLPCYWADRDDGLARVYPDPVTGNPHGLWVLAHPDVRRTARVRAFVESMSSVLLGDRDLFEGRCSVRT
jgi:DNA-binding transcriptional LysR family regulator